MLSLILKVHVLTQRQCAAFLDLPRVTVSFPKGVKIQ